MELQVMTTSVPPALAVDNMIGRLDCKSRKTLCVLVVPFYLYDWWPLRRRGRVYEKLSWMRVEVRNRQA